MLGDIDVGLSLGRVPLEIGIGQSLAEIARHGQLVGIGVIKGGGRYAIQRDGACGGGRHRDCLGTCIPGDRHVVGLGQISEGDVQGPIPQSRDSVHLRAGKSGIAAGEIGADAVPGELYSGAFLLLSQSQSVRDIRRDHGAVVLINVCGGLYRLAVYLHRNIALCRGGGDEPQGKRHTEGKAKEMFDRFPHEDAPFR